MSATWGPWLTTNEAREVLDRLDTLADGSPFVMVFIPEFDSVRVKDQMKIQRKKLRSSRFVSYKNLRGVFVGLPQRRTNRDR